MDSKNEKILQELIQFYHTKCASDAKILREVVEEGDAVSMYATLLTNLKLPFEWTSEKLLHSARFFYFLGYCLKYNDGIPIIEILNASIDNSKKDKVINAVKSQKSLLYFLISKAVDKVKLEDYVAEREIIEYAIDENSKSTGVLKQLLAISKQVPEMEAKQTNSFETKNELSESEKYEQSIRVTKIATDEDIERFNQWQGNTIKVGDKYSIIPEPNNKEELFERFEKLHAQSYFERLQGIFIQKYGVGNQKIIKDELSALNSFIEKANELSTTETFKNKWVDPKEADLYEYSRLANNYYKNPQLPFYPLSYFNNNAIQVYAQYFLYKQWLEDKLVELKKVLPTQQTTEQMKENLLQLVACSKGDEIIDEIDKIYLDKSLLTGRKIVLIGDRKDIFKLGEKHIIDGVASISFDEKEYIFPEWKIKDIVDCCKDRLKKLKRRQAEEAINVEYNFKSVITTISESCKEIVAQPELYKTLKKHFEGILDKQRENHRTAHIISKFNNKSSKYIIENQHLTGQSETKKSAGTVDFAVFFNKEIIAKGESVNSSGQNTNSIDRNIVRHLKKLSRNYNHSSLPDLILLVYYEGSPEKFFDSYDNYRKHFAKYTAAVIKSTKPIDDISGNIVTNSSSIKIAKSIHSYSGNDENGFSIYHFYIDFSEK